MRDSPVFLERPRQVVPHSVPVATTPVTPSQSTFGPKYGQDPARIPDKVGQIVAEPVVTGGPGSTAATTPSNLNLASTVGGGKDAGVRTTGVLGTKKMLPDTQIAADAAAGGGTNPLTPIMNLATREVQTPFGSYAMWVLAVVAFLAWRVVKKVF